MRRFLGITREARFSPGRVEDDAAILFAVADVLRAEGHHVALCSADDARWPDASDDTVVFTMGQGDDALARLQRWEARGIRVINGSAGILNCQRHRTVPLLSGVVSFPTSVLVEVGDGVRLPDWVSGEPAWVKRGDVHAMDSDDVVAARGPAEVRDALRRFQARGIRRAVVQRHVPGTVVKFYAVWQRFFYCVPPAMDIEVPLDIAQHIECLGQNAAQQLGLEIYGGDCVYDSDGRVTLIDLNDWPSYLRCRAAAAAAIAAHVKA